MVVSSLLLLELRASFTLRARALRAAMRGELV
jgi:hypothetical protein